jgi:hypothetical protein
MTGDLRQGASVSSILRWLTFSTSAMRLQTSDTWFSRPLTCPLRRLSFSAINS